MAPTTAAVSPSQSIRPAKWLRGRGSVHMGTNTYASAVGDFNGDGIDDLAVTTFNSDVSSLHSRLIGNGDGTFQTRSPV